jgi:hypothetical protein
LVDHLPQQVIVCPTEILDLDDKLGSHPMNPAENEGRPETAGARRRHIQWHVGCGERLQEVPQSLKLRIFDTTSSATGVY